MFDPAIAARFWADQTQYPNFGDTGVQGRFRVAPLNLDLMGYAHTAHNLSAMNCSIVVTCMDCVKKFEYIHDSTICWRSSAEDFTADIATLMDIPTLYSSYKPGEIKCDWEKA